MSLKDASDYCMVLKKFISKETPKTSEIEQAMDVLKMLADFEMTVDVLKESKIGHIISKLRKHETESVALSAKGLLKEWKNLAVSTPRSGSKPADSDNVKLVEVKERSPYKQKRVDSNVKLPPLSGMRQKVRDMLIEILKMTKGENHEWVAARIEAAMATEYSMDTPSEKKKEYSMKVRQLQFNLKKNEVLRENLLDELITAPELIQLAPEELATKELKKEIEKLRDDAFQKSRLDWAEANAEKINAQCGIKSEEGLFKCGRCKSSKTSNTQKQTRSADEPMTVFVVCHNCGKRWKC